MSLPHRHLRRFAGAGLATVLLMAGLLPFSPSAAAALADCNGPLVSSSIKGFTMNRTGLKLTRIYDEKGVLNDWGQQPAATIGAHDNDHWCAYAHAFGTAMKAEYSFADGNVVYLEAYRYQSSAVGSSCVIKGPSADRFTCAPRIFGSQRASIQADFTVSARR